MQCIGYVNSEGGPLLFADAAVINDWYGDQRDGDDYQRACEILIEDVDGGTLKINDMSALIWDMGGPGTADVFFDSSEHIVVVRCWLSEEDDAVQAASIASIPLLDVRKSLGTIEVRSDFLAVMWSVEKGESIPVTCVENGMVRSTTGDSSAVLVRVECGEYICISDEITIKDIEARRCHLFNTTTIHNGKMEV